jgi:predicted molibdopterin-dependent oxidoreductase YjgC
MLTADRVVHTTCPYCGVGCQLNLRVRDGLIFRADGRYDNEVNYGNLCVKGRFGYDYVHAPDRLTTPLVKDEGGRMKDESLSPQSSVLTPTSWDTALDVVAERLKAIRQQYGPDSIAVLVSAKCTNEENYLLQKVARGLLGTNNIDHCARL